MFYDLHIHSCLSPCGSEDMTVNNIANMAALKGLEIVALTDHNTVGNCAAFLAAAERAGLIALPGMELTTSENLHAVCLFRDIRGATAFGEYVDSRLPNIKNRPEIFGRQVLCGENDEMLGEVEKLLLNAAGISLYDLPALMREYRGIFFPAHIDKPSYSLLSVLGTAPADIKIDAFEIFDPKRLDEIIAGNPALAGLPPLKNSDAHDLQNISEAVNALDGRIIKLLR